jgi:predicted nucleic acid-binding protein
MAGISVTDAEVIALALERGGSILSEDLLLSKKAQKLAIPVYNLSKLIVLYYQYGRINQADCWTRLKKLVDKKIIPKNIYRQLVESLYHEDYHFPA